jgi:hypothetical protein
MPLTNQQMNQLSQAIAAGAVSIDEWAKSDLHDKIATEKWCPSDTVEESEFSLENFKIVEVEVSANTTTRANSNAQDQQTTADESVEATLKVTANVVTREKYQGTVSIDLDGDLLNSLVENLPEESEEQ